MSPKKQEHKKSDINKQHLIKNNASAPYNFIPFPEKVFIRYNSIDVLPKHNVYGKDLLNGVIEYEIENKTPLYIGGATERGIIPSSTMRGNTSNNLEILSFSYPHFFKDEKFTYRFLGSSISELRKKYRGKYEIRDKNNKVIGSLIKVGLLSKNNENEYIIKECEEYKKIEDIQIVKEGSLKEITIKECFQKFVNWKDGKVCEYKAGEKKFILLNNNKIDKKRKYYLINTKLSGEEYKIGEVGDKYRKELKDKVFITESGSNNEELKELNDKIKKFYDLPNENEEKVFFFKEEKGEIAAIGRSEYLRFEYNESTKDLLDKNMMYNSKEIDYVEAIFGFTNKLINKETKSYKSRVSFTDLTIVGEPRYEKETKLMLEVPKAKDFQLYLKDKKNEENLVTYDDKNAILAGRKFYKIKKGVDKNSIENFNKEFKAISKGSTFTGGRIYFENLHEDELGLLLMALKLDDKVYENIGMGKPYGYGNIKIKNMIVKVENREYKEKSFKTFFVEDIELKKLTDKLIMYYQKKFKEKILTDKEISLDVYNKNIENYKKSKKVFENKKEHEYMKLGSKKSDINEFKKRHILKYL